MVDTSDSACSLTDFKRHTADFLRKMRTTGQPVSLTIRGRAEMVVQDAASYQKLLEQFDELQAVAGIRRGLADVAAGRTTPVGDFEKEFRRRHGLPRRARRFGQGGR
jgi:prevent-host-death family protein